MTDDNGVGYGRPPKHTRFKPGQSGNPLGRPKGVKNLQSVIQKEAYAKIVIKENGKLSRVTKVEALFKSTMAKGIKGDTKAAAIALRLLETYLPHGDAEAGHDQYLTEEELKVLRSHADFLSLLPVEDNDEANT